MKKLYGLQMLRGIAIIMIFLSHCGGMLNISRLGEWGSIGVSIFIMLSGFVIFYSHWDAFDVKEKIFPQTLKYIKRKWKQFYGLYFLTFLAALALEILFIMYDPSQLKMKLLKLAILAVVNLLLLQSYIPDMQVYFSLNQVGWYLSDSMFFYLIAPGAIKITKKISEHMKIYVLLIIFCIQVIYTLLVFQMPEYHAYIYINPVFRSLEFIEGGILGSIFLNYQDKQKNYNKQSCLEILILILFSIEVGIYRYFPSGFSLCVAYIPVCAVMIYAFALGGGIVSKYVAKENSFLVKLGDMSFEIFLIHLLVIRYLSLLVDIGILLDNRIFLFVLSVLGTLGVSCICYNVRNRRKTRLY